MLAAEEDSIDTRKPLFVYMRQGNDFMDEGIIFFDWKPFAEVGQSSSFAHQSKGGQRAKDYHEFLAMSGGVFNIDLWPMGAAGMIHTSAQ